MQLIKLVHFIKVIETRKSAHSSIPLIKQRCFTSLLTMETAAPIVFRSCKSVLEVLQNKELSGLEPVQELLNVYDKTRQEYGHLKKGEAKQHPFIVFEGLDATGKTTISKKIAKRYNAKLMCTPPTSISKLRTCFEGRMLAPPFYSLGNYIAELEILAALQDGSVVLDRFWHSTAAFWLAQSIQAGETNELPQKSDEIYIWPSDLLKPDLVIALETSEETRRRRIATRKVITTQEELLEASVEFRKNIMQGYRNMVDPQIVFVDSNGTVNQVVRVVNDIIKDLF